MDVKAYFQKIRSVEQELGEGDVVVVSLDTSDGGRAGRVMELSKCLAAKMIVDRRARLANADEAGNYRATAERERIETQARSVEPRQHFLSDITEVRKGAQRGKR